MSALIELIESSDAVHIMHLRMDNLCVEKRVL